VKAITETPKANVTVRARLRCTFPSVSEPPTITGKRGKTHGASTVRIPAIKEIRRRIIDRIIPREFIDKDFKFAIVLSEVSLGKGSVGCFVFRWCLFILGTHLKLKEIISP
jgi:hypothetical protein